MWRSLVLPGWGQFHNRRPVKACVIAALEVGSAAAYLLRREEVRRMQAASPEARRNVFLFSTVAVVLYSMADAYVDAHLDAVDWGATVRAGASGPEARLGLLVRF